MDAEKSRCEIVRNLDCDIVGISESHLTHGNVIEIDGYRWYGKNRITNTSKPSGGVGILVKHTVM